MGDNDTDGKASRLLEHFYYSEAVRNFPQFFSNTTVYNDAIISNGLKLIGASSEPLPEDLKEYLAELLTAYKGHKASAEGAGKIKKLTPRTDAMIGQIENLMQQIGILEKSGPAKA